MYILSPKVFELLDHNKKLDMPNLFIKAIEQKRKHICTLFIIVGLNLEDWKT